MGLAASQARLLLLTARKSDLEYRAQMISQRKTMLAMQTEELALNYSNALNNRALFYTYTASSTNGTSQTELLTYDNFTAVDNGTGGISKYRLVTPDGKVLARSVEEANEKYKGNGDKEYTEDDVLVLSAAFSNPQYLQDLISSGALIIEQSTPSTYYSYNDTLYTNSELTEQINTAMDDKTDAERQEAINAAKQDPVVKSSWNSIALSAMTDVASRLDETDDAAASAEYEYQSLIIQNADSQLDVELKQVETQQKACETEIDSVKKIIEKNIESGFKTFA